ncbi:hypothetical protein NECAME_07992 [Necator americanus]|uniref:G-protein coupled receptors family 1 profile domain-containing protein n=1 Tax=Necator americanus TaxID=51031 RepID=W2TK09_NECAM|nr:hypothetical protein NECAME_07992 [Necator americanus]ETN82415.1 hypothetical protein NECAME_07992 [Necator americanus]
MDEYNGNLFIAYTTTSPHPLIQSSSLTSSALHYHCWGFISHCFATVSLPFSHPQKNEIFQRSVAMLQCRDDPPLFNLDDNATVEFFQGLQAFSEIYTILHRYLCLVLCSVGIIVNTLHFFVLSRRPMRAYIINALLCAMAVCDALTMTSYLIYILRFRIFDNATGVYGYSYPWLVFLIVHVTSSIALHTGSLYLSVTMAYIRWTALDRLDAKWINNSAIRHIFFFTAFSVTFISIPNLLVHKIVSVNEFLGTNITQAVPCALLLWFTIALIWKLCEMSEKRRLLRGDGMLAVLSAIYPTHIHTMVYINVGEILDLLSLVNCLTSFVLYCCMSSTYRATVKALLMPNRRTSVQKNTLAAQSLRLLMS